MNTRSRGYTRIFPGTFNSNSSGGCVTPVSSEVDCCVTVWALLHWNVRSSSRSGLSAGRSNACPAVSEQLLRSQPWAGAHKQRSAPSCHLGWGTKTLLCPYPQPHHVLLSGLGGSLLRVLCWAGPHCEAPVSCTEWEAYGLYSGIRFQVRVPKMHSLAGRLFLELSPNLCKSLWCVCSMYMGIQLLCYPNCVLLSKNYWQNGRGRCSKRLVRVTLLLRSLQRKSQMDRNYFYSLLIQVGWLKQASGSSQEHFLLHSCWQISSVQDSFN